MELQLMTNVWNCKIGMNVWKWMHRIAIMEWMHGNECMDCKYGFECISLKACKFVNSSLVVSEVMGWGLKG